MATAKRSMTTAARLARIERALEALVASPAPAVSAPATPKAAAPAPDGFVTFLRERAAAKVACDIHLASTCNRRFSSTSSGRQGHVARLV